MKKLLPVAFAVSLAATSLAALAQAQPQDPANPMRAGESPRCDAMTGEERTQCLKDEAAKTENKQDDSSSAGASSGSSSASPADASKPETPSATDTPPSTDTAK